MQEQIQETPVEEPEANAVTQVEGQIEQQTEVTAEEQAQAEAQVEAEAAASAQVEAQNKARSFPKKKAAPTNTEAINQAAAVANAADELFPDVNKMTAVQKRQYVNKKASEAASEKRRLKEKAALENPTVDENGEHIQTVAEAKVEAA